MTNAAKLPWRIGRSRGIFRFKVLGSKFKILRGMASFKNFEEIEVWQKARVLANKIYELTLEGSFAKDYKL